MNISKSDRLKEKKQSKQKLTNKQQKYFKEQCISFKKNGYEITFHLINPQKILIKALPLQSLTSSNYSSNQQDEFSFHYVYQFQLTQEFVLKIYGQNKFMLNVQGFFNFVRKIIERYNYEIKQFQQECYNKFKKTQNLLSQQQKQSIKKQRDHFLNSYDQIIQNFNSKYLQIQEKGIHFITRQDKQPQRNNNLKHQSIKKQYQTLKQSQKSHLIIKLANIFQKYQQQHEGFVEVKKSNNLKKPYKVNIQNGQLKKQHIQNKHSQRHANFMINLKPRLLSSLQFSHIQISHNFHLLNSLKDKLSIFMQKALQTQHLLQQKATSFIKQLKQTAEQFEQEAIKNVLLKLNTGLKVKRQINYRQKQIPQEFMVNGVNATYQYRSNQANINNNRIKQQIESPEIQLMDHLQDAVKIPLQFDQQSGSYHHFSISDNLVSKNGGNWYQILHFKYRLSSTGRYTCTMKLVKTHSQICWLGIMQQQTKYHMHTSQMRNCLLYHTKHCRIQSNLSGIPFKSKLSSMLPLQDGDWIKMIIDMNQWKIYWQLSNGRRNSYGIPQELRGMYLRPVVLLYRIGDMVQFQN